MNGRPLDIKGDAKQIAFNAVPHIDVFLENGYTKEEMKIVWETQKILEDPEIAVNATAPSVLIPFIAPLLGEQGQAVFFDDPRGGQKFFGVYGATKAAQIAQTLLARDDRDAQAWLLLARAARAGGDAEAALDAACALEALHAYTLIHDDLPCMDDAEMRRGKLACHKAFGEAMAVLAGDALLTLAFEVLGEIRKHLF